MNKFIIAIFLYYYMRYEDELLFFFWYRYIIIILTRILFYFILIEAKRKDIMSYWPRWTILIRISNGRLIAETEISYCKIIFHCVTWIRSEIHLCFFRTHGSKHKLIVNMLSKQSGLYNKYLITCTDSNAVKSLQFNPKL